MYEFIEGEVAQISPTSLVLEAGGVGYFLQISLYTYEKLRQQKRARILVHHAFRIENQAPAGMVLYGFAEPRYVPDDGLGKRRRQQYRLAHVEQLTAR